MARPGLTTHRKFRRLARALGSPLIARGALELLWDACYDSGEDYVGTADDIEHLVGWTGERGALAAALVDAGAPEGQGFIEPLDEGVQTPVRYRVHDLWDHVPHRVARRRRRGDQPLTSGQQTATSGRPLVSTAQKKVDLCTTDPDLHTEREERSEQDLQIPDRRTANRPVLSYPVVGRGASTWTLTEGQLAEWQPLFPSLDVLGEARKALAWVTVNVGRRKTASGMPRFLVNWFTRATNRGGGRKQEVQERPFSERETQAARDWWRRVGCSFHGVDPNEAMANFIRTRLRLES